MTDRRMILAGAALLSALAACGADPGGETVGQEQARGLVYGVSDDHELVRWEVGSESAEPVLDLSGVWDRAGDVGTVLNASLTIDPTGHRAAWIAGGDEDSRLMLGDLATGRITPVADYPLDHACIDPAWAPDGSRLLVHRAEVWDEPRERDQAASQNAGFGEAAWYTVEGDRLTERFGIDPGCRVRWYATENGLEGLYRDLEVGELRRIDARGRIIETAPIDSFSGVAPEVTDLVEVDPAGRYACIADGYAPESGLDGGFRIRPETGTNVIDLMTGESVGSACESMGTEAYLARAGGAIALTDYEGRVVWEADLPPELAHSPNLWYFP